MRQWDVFMFPFSQEKRQPAVILSNVYANNWAMRWPWPSRVT